jgi:hypothetical protein
LVSPPSSLFPCALRLWQTIDYGSKGAQSALVFVVSKEIPPSGLMVCRRHGEDELPRRKQRGIFKSNVTPQAAGNLTLVRLWRMKGFFYPPSQKTTGLPVDECA